MLSTTHLRKLFLGSIGYEDVPLGQPTVRQWEIDGNATRYDRLQAAPSDDDLVIMWSLWSVISGLIGLFVFLVLLSIVMNRKARENPFNLYLVYLMIPDIIFSAFCALTCTLNAWAGEYYSVFMCQAQSFYLVFGIAGNSWLNMMIARELHLLLQASVNMKKYSMPQPRKVTNIAMGVYAYSLFISSWGIWGSRLSWFPHGTVSISGLGCFPLEYNLASTLFYFLCFIPLVAGIPIGYVLYTCYDMHKRKLMPPSGKRRMLSIYFLRVVAAYVFMWMPHLLLCLMGTGKAWAVFAGGTWGHFQGVVSAGLSLTKPDIYKVFIGFMTCGRYPVKNDAPEIPERSSSLVSRRGLWPSTRRNSNAGRNNVHVSGLDLGRMQMSTAVSAISAASEVDCDDSDDDEYLPRQRADFTFDDEERDPAEVPSVQVTSAARSNHKWAPQAYRAKLQSELADLESPVETS